MAVYLKNFQTACEAVSTLPLVQYFLFWIWGGYLLFDESFVQSPGEKLLPKWHQTLKYNWRFEEPQNKRETLIHCNHSVKGMGSLMIFLILEFFNCYFKINFIGKWFTSNVSILSIQFEESWNKWIQSCNHHHDQAMKECHLSQRHPPDLT